MKNVLFLLSLTIFGSMAIANDFVEDGTSWSKRISASGSGSSANAAAQQARRNLMADAQYYKATCENTSGIYSIAVQQKASCMTESPGGMFPQTYCTARGTVHCKFDE